MKKRWLWILLFNTVLSVILYFTLAQFSFPIHYVYLALGGGLALFYFIYNRGFVNKNAKIENLPESMTDEEKRAFIDLGKKRFEKSRPVLLVLIPVILTFLCDMLYLFVYPMIAEIFS